MREQVSCRRYHAFSVVIAAFVFFTLCWTNNPASAATPGDARKEIKLMGIEYTEQQFATSAGAGDMTAVKLFLNAGMDINAGGGSALGLAAGRGQIEMVKFLLSEGAKPTSNSLQFARTRGYQEIEKILVKAGAKE